MKSKLLHSLLEALEIYSENEADSKGLTTNLVEKYSLPNETGKFIKLY